MYRRNSPDTVMNRYPRTATNPPAGLISKFAHSGRVGLSAGRLHHHTDNRAGRSLPTAESCPPHRDLRPGASSTAAWVRVVADQRQPRDVTPIQGSPSRPFPSTTWRAKLMDSALIDQCHHGCGLGGVMAFVQPRCRPRWPFAPGSFPPGAPPAGRAVLDGSSQFDGAGVDRSYINLVEYPTLTVSTAAQPRQFGDRLA